MTKANEHYYTHSATGEQCKLFRLEEQDPITLKNVVTLVTVPLFPVGNRNRHSWIGEEDQFKKEFVKT